MIGRLTASPKIMKTSNDKSILRITIAVNRRFKNKNGERGVDFVSVTFWDRLAETLSSYGSKGTLLSFDGELRTRSYDKMGQKQYITEVVGRSFQFLESKSQRAMRENNISDNLTDIVLEEEELPF